MATGSRQKLKGGQSTDCNTAHEDDVVELLHVDGEAS